MDTRLTTYQDLISHALDFLGANPGGDASRDARRAVLAAYREFAAECRWTYFLSRGRVLTSAHQTAGTIEYIATGGTYERQVTLTGATWPAWAAQGQVTINNVVCDVAAVKSSTVLTLTQGQAPDQDVAAGSPYTLYRDCYPLPVDCLAIDRTIIQNNVFNMWYESPGVWLERQRVYHSPATPRSYTITSSPDYLGSMAVRFFPAPDNDYAIDFIYHRRPRPLRFEAIGDGSVSVTNGVATVTGVGTNFSARHVGSVLRLSNSISLAPTGEAGSNQAYFERIVTAVSSPTSLTVDAVFDESLTGVKYVLSDPADIEEGAMLQGLLRCVEKQVATSRNMKTLDRSTSLYREALIKAREADSRDFSSQQAGASSPFPYRLAQMPRGPDVS